MYLITKLSNPEQQAYQCSELNVD